MQLKLLITELRLVDRQPQKRASIVSKLTEQFSRSLKNLQRIRVLDTAQAIAKKVVKTTTIVKAMIVKATIASLLATSIAILPN